MAIQTFIIFLFTLFKTNSCTSLNTLSHPRFKTLKFLKIFCKTSLKPYMFRSLLYDHPQGSSFVLSALPILRLFASSSGLFGMWLYVVYVCVCPMYLSVGYLVVKFVVINYFFVKWTIKNHSITHELH
jgi:hypothetical protein